MKQKMNEKDSKIICVPLTPLHLPRQYQTPPLQNLSSTTSTALPSLTTDHPQSVNRLGSLPSSEAFVITFILTRQIGECGHRESAEMLRHDRSGRLMEIISDPYYFMKSHRPPIPTVCFQ
ncbi:hypothetical protein LINGRAPRIM_LOCUS2196, partial [Linum grandiflorum]